jgi:phage terminase small subunit
MADKLTIKQERFAQGLFAGLSQREAYKQAYNAERMKDKTIDEAAARLAADSKVAARIQQLTDELKERNMVTVERVLAELAKVGFADIKDYLQYKTVKAPVGEDKETGEPVIDYRPIIDVIDSGEVDGAPIQEVSIGKDGTFKFKLHDKMAALDKMGKFLGMFTDKMEVTGKDGGPIDIDLSGLDTEQLKKLADKL